MTDGEFADNTVLLAETHKSAEIMVRVFVDVRTAFGLTVNMAKTVFMEWAMEFSSLIIHLYWSPEVWNYTRVCGLDCWIKVRCE